MQTTGLQTVNCTNDTRAFTMQTPEDNANAPPRTLHQYTQPLDPPLDLDAKALMLATAIVALALLLGTYTIGKVKNVQLKNTEQSLNLAVNKTEQSLIYWKNINTTNLENIANVPAFSALIKEQLSIYKNGGNLFGNNLTRLREFFTRNQAIFGAKGFFIIAPDGTNVASLRDNNIGIPNLIMRHRTLQFDNVLQGQSQFIAPIPSDVAIIGQKNIKGLVVPASAFFAVPIKDADGITLGILTQRINPDDVFSALHNPSDSIPTMDIYSINLNGLLISNPTQTNIFYQQGMLKANDTAVLSVSALSENLTGNLLFAGGQSSSNLRTLSEEVLNQKHAGKIIANMRGYVNIFKHPVYGAGIWNEELGIGIIAERQQEASLESYYWLKKLILASISTLILFVILTTAAWLRSHKKMLNDLKAVNQTLAKTETQRANEFNNNLKETQRLFALQNVRNQAINQYTQVSITDTQGIITSINKAFEIASGYNQADLIGKNHRILNSGHHTHAFWENFYTTITNHGLWKGEIKNRNKNGGFYWVNSTVAALKDSKGETTQFISIHSNITELKESQKQLGDQNHLLKLATEAAEIGIWVLELKSGTLTWDHQMHCIYGIEPKDFQHSFIDWKSALHPNDAKNTILKLEEAIQQHTRFDCEFRILTPQKVIKYIKASGQVIYDENKLPVTMVGINYAVFNFKMLDDERNISP